ncbi:N-acetylmuramoyl-L-alanine amidase [Apilactobacillus timberlakei]|uniref:N-acetylmuramoyl-L-alanine amidase n=1 Tax=Apilactobacillus timberlakei TaxID=2008380 RepID=A0ABY2YUN5_9LACO|nr:N-acetylmuramoyl-L-alanine amidase [Apilactobacillus timberlakei]TPR13257.1 N-acetylmuramoyl-L-alanine amidase [Apilactobacillus timberlakei]TPR14293.1 N-acetylmuramoyl-L-alanine amidase [Apilactobacillus timberlakei]TPR16546.1 N-acetylmuramoyl-L-alanine amidase [Apilactobacillus timberlakei]TPR19233.1 N-acetylmuramoyl-L-alanine amidase [Apilactobacillus timberlakei]TPR19606.1 N-acetylmuramoyl-L-alanine amidase [Apilactobacillus timberlakei]
MIKQIWIDFRNAPLKIWLIRGIISAILLIMLIIELARLISFPKVEAEGLNLRNAPNDQSQIIEQVPHGQHLKIIKSSENNWWYVKYNNHKGWVASWLLNQKNYNPKSSNKMAEATIVIDPGHGGSDSGTLSANQQYMEKTYTLKIADKVAKRLKNLNANVIMTRDSDRYVSLGQRTRLSNNVKADLFISFHFDSANGDGSASGFGVYKYHPNADKIANTVNEGFDLPLHSRGVSMGDYYVLRENKQPAILLEMGFMDSNHDLQYIRSNSYQENVANQVGKSINKYFNE